MPRLALVALALFFASACISPVTRPTKIKPGLSGTVGGAVLYGADDEEICHDGCRETEVEAISVLHLDGRFGFELSDTSALAFGGYIAGGSTTKVDPDDSPLYGNTYLQVAHQTDSFALSLALELGFNAIGPTLSAQFWPRPDRQHFSLQAYARALRPISEDAVGKRSGIDVVETRDIGFAVRVARVLLQYSFYSRKSGLDEFPLPVEGAAKARDWHIFVIGHEF